MPSTRDFTGCKVLLRNPQNDQTLLESLVLECDTQTLNIVVPAPGLDVSLHRCFSVVIFSGHALYEYRGNFRGMSGSENLLLALHHGGKKEDLRGSARFDLNKSAYVLRNREPTPRPIRVLDISTSGALLEGPVTVLYEQDICRLCLEIGGNEVFLDTRVMRKQVTPQGTARYGCAFLARTDASEPDAL